MTLRDSDIQAINQRLLYNLPSVRTALGVAFGARAASPYVAMQTAQLYKDGYIDKVLITGGNSSLEFLSSDLYDHLNTDIPVGFPLSQEVVEAATIRQILLKMDINPDDIVSIEDQSTNLNESIDYCQEILKNFYSVQLITLAYRQRRTLGTYRKNFPDTDYRVTTTPVYPFHFTHDNWHQHVEARSQATSEFEKINPDNPDNYMEQGYCVEVNPYKEHALARGFNPQSFVPRTQ